MDKLMSDEAILQEMGKRLTRYRIDQQLTQSALAQEAGISKRTVERIEAGTSTQVSSLVRVLRVLDLLPGLEALAPDPGIRPMDLLQKKGRYRVRASSPAVESPPAWTED